MSEVKREKGSLGIAWALRGLLESNVIGRLIPSQWGRRHVCGVRVMDCMVAGAKTPCVPWDGCNATA
ncbi:hypothetical protein FVQ98_03395 [Ottowia sp. GY511]|uniref:Uncharacterized protein n=2 Tax=Comamonadaceae TaxID=80864 RepID=A0ABW4KV96_9BURK|nr:hypothetical protein FVQ98_03395 [Ottowia sp. GY511]